MGYYYSGSVRKQFVPRIQLQIIAKNKAERRQHIKNNILASLLILCWVAVSWIESNM
jgi:uncharacterized BrkB/YihY/UPF0761 family membrane protein